MANDVSSARAATGMDPTLTFVGAGCHPIGGSGHEGGFPDATANSTHSTNATSAARSSRRDRGVGIIEGLVHATQLDPPSA